MHLATVIVADEREIENFLYLCAERLDSGDIDGMARLFEQAELLEPNGEVQGFGADINKNFVRLYDDGTPKAHHVTSNAILLVDGNAASCQSYFTVFQSTDTLPLQPIIAGRYENEFRTADEKWHFHSRKIIPGLLGDMVQHQHVPFG